MLRDSGDDMIAVALALMLSVGSQSPAAPRNWDAADQAVKFVRGTQPPMVKVNGTWAGSETIGIRCLVLPNGGLDNCDVVAESAPGRLNRRSAQQGVDRMRLDLGEQGPQPGDTLTIVIVVTTDP